MKLTRLGMGILALAFLGWSGCATNPEDGGKVTRKPCVLDELRLGDMVTVTFSDLPQPGIPEQKVRIKDDGTLSLPMNQSVVAAGKKIGLVEKEIVALYLKYFRQVSVTVKTEDRFYSVGGEVKAPGRQLYLGMTTLVRAIQSCGDFTDFAKRGSVKIHRADGRLETVDANKARGNPKYDVIICPGDAIIVERRGL